MVSQLIAIFAFGSVVTGVVFLGIVRAREIQARVAKVEAAQARHSSAN